MTVAHALERAGNCGARLADCFRNDARLLIRATLWRLALPVLKRAFPLRTLVRWMHSPARPDVQRLERLSAVRHLVSHGGRLVISGNCLERSLVLYRFLTEADARPSLVMGVNRDRTTDGHAWIEVDGEPLADTTTGRFTRVLLIDPDGAVQPIVPCKHV